MLGVFLLLHRLARTCLSPLPQVSPFPDTTILRLGQLTARQWPLSVQVKGEVVPPLMSHQKLEAIELSEEGLSGAKMG